MASVMSKIVMESIAKSLINKVLTALFVCGSFPIPR